MARNTKEARKPEGAAPFPRDTTVSANETLNVALTKHSLRIARADDLPGWRFVVECRVCGEVDELQHWNQVRSECSVCGIAWSQSSPVFLVLRPR